MTWRTINTLGGCATCPVQYVLDLSSINIANVLIHGTTTRSVNHLPFKLSPVSQVTARQTAQRLDLLEIHIFPVKSSESVINDDTITKASKRTSSPLTLSTVVWDSNAGNVDPGHYRYTYTLSLSSLTLPWPAIFREQPFTSSHHWPIHHFGNIHFPHFWAENIAIFLEGVRNVGFKVRNPPANCLEGRSFLWRQGHYLIPLHQTAGLTFACASLCSLSGYPDIHI